MFVSVGDTNYNATLTKIRRLGNQPVTHKAALTIPHRPAIVVLI